MNDNEKRNQEQTTKSEVTRRRLLQSGWTAPVIAALSLRPQVALASPDHQDAPAGHTDTPGTPHSDGAGHVDGAPHSDTAHSDGSQHTDRPARRKKPHIDTYSHTDTVHADAFPHADSANHYDTPSGPHADTPIPHSDIP